MFKQVNPSYFKVFEKERVSLERSAATTRAFAPTRIPFMFAPRRSAINKATCSQDLRKATIGMWENIYDNVIDQGTRKLRRCKCIECIGSINVTGQWESHTIYKLAALGGGQTFGVSHKDIVDFNVLVEEKADEYKRSILGNRRMINQGN
jgi:hypothetical protein